jgi:carbon-monoxide dehydrogenase large subunit
LGPPFIDGSKKEFKVKTFGIVVWSGCEEEFVDPRTSPTSSDTNGAVATEVSVIEQADAAFVGRSIPRREDRRLLLGKGQYIGDLALPGMLHAAFVRSPVAHARIRSVDMSRAASSPGVALVLSGADLLRALPPVQDNQVVLPRKWKEAIPHRILNPRQPLLAVDKARHVGEAIAVVVAENRYVAEDAAELVSMEFDPLPPVVDPDAALAAGAPLLHEQLGTNEIGRFSIRKGDVEAAFERAALTVRRRFAHHRYAAMPMECRGVIAAHDVRTDSLTVWSSTQVVHWIQRELATTLGVPEACIRCVALDVGGGFGVKGHVYPEDLLIPFLARTLERPVRWLEDRREHMSCSCHSRDQIHDAEAAFDQEGRILGFRDSFAMDCGAWNPLGVAPVYNTAVHLPGPYKIEHLAINARVAATNKVPNAPYRGAGRPEAVQVMERLMDLAANVLGLEPAEVRRRNMIRADQMPYRMGIPYRDGEPIVYDSGDFPGALHKALDALGGVEAFRQRQREARRQGRYLGLGIGCYTEGTGAGPFEGATVRIDASGKIHVSSGACPQGQGMETIFAQVTADAWNVEPDDVVVSLADTAAISMGFGTIASRTTVNLSGAIHYASERLRKKAFAIASHMLECAATDLELRKRAIGVVGVPGAQVTLAQLAHAARPGWDHGRPPDIEAGLQDTHYYEPPTVTWSYAVHAAQVEVDIQTGGVKIERYAIAHDCGVLVNPMLAEGQIVGGAIQGLGGALLEEVRYDTEGQLLCGSFMDYLVPTASDAPHIDLVHQQIPTPLNPFGVKGLGEGGAIAPPVAIANAVSDALSPFGAEFNSTPIRPEQIVLAVACGQTGGKA